MNPGQGAPQNHPEGAQRGRRRRQGGRPRGTPRGQYQGPDGPQDFRQPGQGYSGGIQPVRTEDPILGAYQAASQGHGYQGPPPGRVGSMALVPFQGPSQGYRQGLLQGPPRDTALVQYQGRRRQGSSGPHEASREAYRQDPLPGRPRSPQRPYQGPAHQGPPQGPRSGYPQGSYQPPQGYHQGRYQDQPQFTLDGPPQRRPQQLLEGAPQGYSQGRYEGPARRIQQCSPQGAQGVHPGPYQGPPNRPPQDAPQSHPQLSSAHPASSSQPYSEPRQQGYLYPTPPYQHSAAHQPQLGPARLDPTVQPVVGKASCGDPVTNKWPYQALHQSLPRPQVSEDLRYLWNEGMRRASQLGGPAHRGLQQGPPQGSYAYSPVDSRALQERIDAGPSQRPQQPLLPPAPSQASLPYPTAYHGPQHSPLQGPQALLQISHPQQHSPLPGPQELLQLGPPQEIAPKPPLQQHPLDNAPVQSRRDDHVQNSRGKAPSQQTPTNQPVERNTSIASPSRRQSQPRPRTPPPSSPQPAAYQGPQDSPLLGPQALLELGHAQAPPPHPVPQQRPPANEPTQSRPDDRVTQASAPVPSQQHPENLIADEPTDRAGPSRRPRQPSPSSPPAPPSVGPRVEQTAPQDAHPEIPQALQRIDSTDSNRGSRQPSPSSPWADAEMVDVNSPVHQGDSKDPPARIPVTDERPRSSAINRGPRRSLPTNRPEPSEVDARVHQGDWQDPNPEIPAAVPRIDPTGPNRGPRQPSPSSPLADSEMLDVNSPVHRVNSQDPPPEAAATDERRSSPAPNQGLRRLLPANPPPASPQLNSPLQPDPATQRREKVVELGSFLLGPRARLIDTHSGTQCDIYVFKKDMPGPIRKFLIQIPKETMPVQDAMDLIKDEVQLRMKAKASGVTKLQELVKSDRNTINPMGSPYLVLEWAEGRPLEWSETYPATEGTRYRILGQLAKATMDLLRCKTRGVPPREWMEDKIRSQLAEMGRWATLAAAAEGPVIGSPTPIREEVDLASSAAIMALMTTQDLIDAQFELLSKYVQPDRGRTPHVLIHGNVDKLNILVDPDFNITLMGCGMMDMVPLQFAASFPRFLTHEPLAIAGDLLAADQRPVVGGWSQGWGANATARMYRDRDLYLSCVQQIAEREVEPEHRRDLGLYAAILSAENEVERYWWMMAAQRADIWLQMIRCGWQPRRPGSAPAPLPASNSDVAVAGPAAAA